VERQTVPIIGDLETLVPSFVRACRARHLSSNTIRSYIEAAIALIKFLDERGMPVTVTAIRREHVEAFIVDQLELAGGFRTISSTSRVKPGS